MSEGVNKVILIGNLGRDPELRYTSGGQAALNMSLACTEKYGTRDGERKERTEWCRVVVWGNRAEALGKFLTKGRTIYVEGRLQTSEYEKNGERRFSTEVVATNIVLMPGGQRDGNARPSNGGGGGYGGGQRSEQRATPGGDDMPPDDFTDDDIPFLANVSAEAGERWHRR